MHSDSKKIVAIYTRVSTTDQAREGHSLEEQEKRLKAMCEANGYTIYKVYTDAGISGKSTENRPDYQQMIKDMKKHKFNLIVAFKMDRLSRSIMDFEEFFNEIKEYDCGVEFLCEKIDTSGAAGMMFARILGIFAQFERELIQERTIVGVESAVNKGHFGGKAPLGYKHKLDETGEEKLKEWEIYQDEANIVKEIFDLCASGKTYVQISHILKKKYPKVISKYAINEETKEKVPVYRTWSDGSISAIVNNKCYIGIYEHRKTIINKETRIIEDKVPQIISEDLFYDCQEAIIRNCRNYYRAKKYLFMQKIKCPKCGRVMMCNGTKKPNGKEYLYYKCKDCAIYIREEMIEEALVNKLNSLLELSNILCSNHVPVDNKTANDFNKGKLKHNIRFAIDTKIISDKKTLLDTMELNELWKMTSYEAKCNFISTYLDSITIEDYKYKGKRIESAKLIELKLKSHKINRLLEYKNSNMIDDILGNGVNKVSIAEMKHEKDALEYIELLRKQYKFAVFDFYKLEDYCLNPFLFKIIKVNPKCVAEKKKVLGLFLLEPSAILENCIVK
ncbi:MAG: recombinase family protein [Bacilli bacterium]